MLRHAGFSVYILLPKPAQCNNTHTTKQNVVFICNKSVSKLSFCVSISNLLMSPRGTLRRDNDVAEARFPSANNARKRRRNGKKKQKKTPAKTGVIFNRKRLLSYLLRDFVEGERGEIRNRHGAEVSVRAVAYGQHSLLRFLVADDDDVRHFFKLCFADFLA